MQTRSFLRQALLATAAAATLWGMTPAQATPFQTGGFIISPDSVNVTAPAYSGPAGGFRGIWDPAPGANLTIDYWCYQLDQEFSPGTTYNYTATPLGNPAIAELFSEAGGLALNSALNSAAFQLAIWELEYDTDHNLSTGSFHAISADAGVIGLAQMWLTNLPTSSNVMVYLLHSDTQQDFITTFPIPTKDVLPEPSSLPLFGLGLAAMIFVGSRRRGTQAGRS
jgi:hypothetical protein